VDNAFVGRSDGNATGQLYAQSLGVALASGNTFDSIAGVGIYHYYGDSLLVDNNTITGLADGGGTGLGINPNRVGTSMVTGNSVTCMGASMGSGLHAYRSTTFASGNTVSGCARGLTALNDGGVTDSVTFTGNRVLGGSMLIGGLVVRGTTVAAFADNVVTGGVLSEGAYAALGTRFVHVPKVTLTGDSVQGGAGRGIVMQWVDTVDIGGTAVSGLGSLYADTTSEAGIWLRNVFGPTYVHGNHVAAGADAGILLSDTARAAALDSNLVVDHGASGLVLRVTTPDTVRGTLNGIRRNQPFGVWIGSVDALLPANDIEGNAFGVFNAAADTVDLRDSYWGDTLGPTCDVGLEYCNVASVGDSIGGFQVGFTFVAVPFAGASVTGAPAGAPPAFALFSTVAPGRTLRARVVPVEPVQPDRPRAALLPPPAPAPASPRREHR
jgi:hypothetical protein